VVSQTRLDGREEWGHALRSDGNDTKSKLNQTNYELEKM
jgi:hypothetical protein